MNTRISLFLAIIFILLITSSAAYAITPVILNEPTNVTAATVDLSWTQNNDPDFNYYEVHKSTTQNFTPDLNTLDTTIYDQMQTGHQVTGLTAGTTYYFKVRVVDFLGLWADSNEVSATTLNQGGGGGPTALTLSVVNTTYDYVELSWSQNQDPDFSRYEATFGVKSCNITFRMVNYTHG